MTFKPSRAGMIALMQSAGVQAAVADAAEAVATAVGTPQAHGGPVEVRVEPFAAPYGNGQVVTLAHAAGVGLEAKHGTLSGAVSSAGLKLNGRRRPK